LTSYIHHISYIDIADNIQWPLTVISGTINGFIVCISNLQHVIVWRCEVDYMHYQSDVMSAVILYCCVRWERLYYMTLNATC